MAHPYGKWSPHSRYTVQWNSVQPKDDFGTDNASNPWLERGRHYYAGPEPYTVEDVKECGRQQGAFRRFPMYPKLNEYFGDLY